jgi:hypothetical protein
MNICKLKNRQLEQQTEQQTELKIPENCICDVNEWGCIANISKICNNFQPYSEEPTICKNCDHDINCHNFNKEKSKKIIKNHGC